MSKNKKTKEQNTKAVLNHRRKTKAKAVAYKGGKCQACGYDRCQEAFDFHHLDPKQKEFGIGANGATRSWAKLQIELDKCILLCANCHRELHAGLLVSVPPGVEA